MSVGAYKPFDNSLYQLNDKKAKDLAIQHLSKKLKDVRENEDKFGPDIYGTTKEGIRVYLEVEIKQNWDRFDFPFDTLNIPSRKGKYLPLYKNLIFLVISRNLKRGIFVRSSDLRKEYLKEVENRYIPSGEKFFQIPVCLGKLVDF